jgi:purine-nucleoside phosphorylase
MNTDGHGFFIVGQAGVGIESILVYAYILIYYFKKQGFLNEGFGSQFKN